MYSPFWEGPIIFKRVFDVSRYISVFASPLVIALYAVLKLVGVNNFYFWGNVLGKISFLLIYTLLFIRFFLDANRGKFDNFVFMSMVVMAAFLLTTLNWFMSWYWIILFVLMIISFAKTKVKTYPYLMVGLSIWAAIQLTVAR
jgi:hypothetical protein